jgi:two-component system response regulator LytT
MIDTLNNPSILMVDDGKDSLFLLQYMLEELGYRRLYACQTFTSALDTFTSESPDICLLDIELGGTRNGINLAEEIRKYDAQVPIIYLTSHFSEDYYDRCKHTYPSSFLNKGCTLLNLKSTIDLALINRGKLPTQNSPSAAHPPMANEQLFFKVGDIFKSVSLTSITFFYAENKLNYARSEGRSYPTSIQLKTLEEDLKPTFLRIHKSYLINTKYIDEINPTEGTVIINGEILPIGNTYKRFFLEKMHFLK